MFPEHTYCSQTCFLSILATHGIIRSRSNLRYFGIFSRQLRHPQVNLSEHAQQITALMLLQQYVTKNPDEPGTFTVGKSETTTKWKQTIKNDPLYVHSSQLHIVID